MKTPYTITPLCTLAKSLMYLLKKKKYWLRSIYSAIRNNRHTL